MPDRASSPDAGRLRCCWSRHARSYDREMAFFERVPFGDGRADQVLGEVGEWFELSGK